MKILFLGHGGFNDKDRIREIRHLDHEVNWETIYPVASVLADRISTKLAAQFKKGPWVSKINSDLLERASRWRGYDLIWMEKALYVHGVTIEKIREQVKCPIVQFTPDIALNIDGTQKSPVYIAAIPAYDAIMTTKDFEIERYWDLGARRVIYFEQAVSHRRFYPRTDLLPAHKADVGFIGHSERHYKSVLRSISAAGMPVHVHGPGWEKWRNRFDPFNHFLVMGPAVRGEAYAQHLSGMCIGLGLLTKLGPEVVTTRSHEIPACGTFLLAERTEKHQELYEEGVEAEYFECNEELIDKARYYLAHPDHRKAIARAGRERFMSSDCRADRQIRIVLSQIIKQLGLPK